MKLLVALLALLAVARADTSAVVKQYAGRIIISPDPAPSMATDLPAYLKANAVAGDRYELVKGSPWHVHIAGFLSKDPRTPTVQLVFVDSADKQAKPISVDVAAKNRLVISHTTATTAAGFEAGKTYAVRLQHGKTVLAKAELLLRP